ncbi:MAG: MBL fold metallo-hydrolase, partial [Phycisphaerae bacterium]|nr:MBL fold metallo-hydrolase [Phycisphaerae bacterium]
RSWVDFCAGHLPKSLFHPLGKSFPADVGSMVEERDPIVLLVEGSRLDEALRMLVRIGLDDVRGWFDAPTLDEYRRNGGTLATSDEIGIVEGESRFSAPDSFLLDVRRADEFAAGAIPGARQISHTRLRAHLKELPKDRHIYVHCRSGQRSARAVALLERHGFTATNLGGGFLAWQKGAAAAPR